MNITKHAKERYVERIKGITDKDERNIYLTLNDDIIQRDIQKLFEYAIFIYKGKIGVDHTSKKFYLNKNIALVVSDTNDIVTIYTICFPFPKEAEEYVIESLSKQIQQIGEEIEVEQEKAKRQLEEETNEKTLLKLQIKALEDKIKELKAKEEALDNARKIRTQIVTTLRSNQQVYAQQLFGNTEYKKDINRIK